MLAEAKTTHKATTASAQRALQVGHGQHSADDGHVYRDHEL